MISSAIRIEYELVNSSKDQKNCRSPQVIIYNQLQDKNRFTENNNRGKFTGWIIV